MCDWLYGVDCGERLRRYALDTTETRGVAPGATKTDALASALTPEIEEKMLEHRPFKGLGEPEDIALAAQFLCSPAASWVSGQLISVSGGGVQELD